MNNTINFDWPDKQARVQSRSTRPTTTAPASPARLVSHKGRLVIERYGLDWFQCLGYPYIHAEPGIDAWVRSPCLDVALEEMQKRHRRNGTDFRVVDRGPELGFQHYSSVKPSPNDQVLLPRLVQTPSDAWDVARHEVDGTEIVSEVAIAPARTQMHWASAWMGTAREARFHIGTDGRGWLVPTRLPLAGIRMTGWPRLTMRPRHVKLLLELLDSDSSPPGMDSRAWKRTKAFKERSLVIIKLPDDGAAQRWMLSIRNAPSTLVIRECQHMDIDTTNATVNRPVCKFRVDIDDLARMIMLASVRNAPCAEFGVNTAEGDRGSLYISQIDRRDSKIRYEEVISIDSCTVVAEPVWWRVNLSQARQAVAVAAGGTKAIYVILSRDPQVAILSSATSLEMENADGCGGDTKAKIRSPQRLVVLPIELMEVNHQLPYIGTRLVGES